MPYTVQFRSGSLSNQSIRDWRASRGYGLTASVSVGSREELESLKTEMRERGGYVLQSSAYYSSPTPSAALQDKMYYASPEGKMNLEAGATPTIAEKTRLATQGYQTGSMTLTVRPSATPGELPAYEHISRVERAVKVAPKVKPSNISVAGAFVNPIGFWDELSAKTQKKSVEVFGAIGRASEPVRVGQASMAESRFSLLEMQKQRYIEDSKLFELHGVEISQRISGSRNERDIQNVIKDFPQYQFTRTKEGESDVISFKSPKLEKRVKSMVNLGVEAEAYQKKSVAIGPFAKAGRAVLGWGVGLPSTVFSVAGSVDRIRYGGVIGLSSVAAGMFKGVKEQPIRSGVMLALDTAAFRVAGRFFPEATLIRKAYKPGESTFRAVEGEGSILKIKGTTKTFIKETVIYKGKPFLGQVRYITKQRSYVLEGNPTSVKTNGDMMMVNYEFKGSTVPSFLPKLDIRTTGKAIFKSGELKGNIPVYESIPGEGMNLIEYKPGVSTSKGISLSRIRVRGNVPILEKTGVPQTVTMGGERFLSFYKVGYKNISSVRSFKSLFSTLALAEIKTPAKSFGVFKQGGVSKIIRRGSMGEPKYYKSRGTAFLTIPGDSFGGGGVSVSSVQYKTLPSGMIYEIGRATEGEVLDFGGGGVSVETKPLSRSIVLDETYVFPESRTRTSSRNVGGMMSFSESRGMLGSVSMPVSRLDVRGASAVSNLPLSVSRVASSSATRTESMSRSLSMTKTKNVVKSVNVSMPLVSITTPGPKIPALHSFKFRLLGGGGRLSYRGPRFRPVYVASVFAGIFNIKGRRPKTVTGLEVRPKSLFKRKKRKGSGFRFKI